MEANLVSAGSGYTPVDDVHNDNHGSMPLVEGQAVVEPSALERAQERRKRFVRILFLVLAVAGVAVGIAVGAMLGINSGRQQQPPPTLAGSAFPSFRQFLTRHCVCGMPARPNTRPGTGWLRPHLISTAMCGSCGSASHWPAPGLQPTPCSLTLSPRSASNGRSILSSATGPAFLATTVGT